jgi:hypothetical protein
MEYFDRGYEFPFDDAAPVVGQPVMDVPIKGVDGGRRLSGAEPNELLKQHLRLERADSRAFWKDGYLLFRLWVTGTFCTIMPEDGVRGFAYPYSREGFHQFLHDHGSQISPDEVSRRIKVFRAYSKYELTTIRLVERAGVNKAFAAIPHIRDETVREMLSLCIDTPYHRLRDALTKTYPRHDAGTIREARPRSEIITVHHRRAVRVIADSADGMLGGEKAFFIPRKFRQDTEEEQRAAEVFDFAMKRLGVNDRDGFFMRVVDLVAKTWLTPDDIQAIETRITASPKEAAAE